MVELPLHISTAHEYWRKKIQPGDLVIDATCGNGKDSLLLAQLCEGNLFCLDIQEAAITKTRARLANELPSRVYNQVTLQQQCHATFPKCITPNNVTAIVYNLGYLPGGDKQVTTQTKTTLESLANALPLIKEGGWIFITCYPGHPEGAVEKAALLAYIDNLSSSEWTFTHREWNNRPKTPSNMIISRLLLRQ